MSPTMDIAHARANLVSPDRQIEGKQCTAKTATTTEHNKERRSSIGEALSKVKEKIGGKKEGNDDR